MVYITQWQHTILGIHWAAAWQYVGWNSIKCTKEMLTWSNAAITSGYSNCPSWNPIHASSNQENHQPFILRGSTNI